MFKKIPDKSMGGKYIYILGHKEKRQQKEISIISEINVNKNTQMAVKFLKHIII